MARSTLDPETRLLYGESLQAPPGHRFDGGVATTFSMDFETALAVPVSLALFAAENRDETLSQPIALLEGAERIADSLAVYVDAGQIHVPAGVANRVCSLLERTVVEVQAPGRGSFHPKLWALRFRPLIDDGPTLMRLLILSRNMTQDRSWDAVVRLDGVLGRQPVKGNAALRDLIAALPGMAVADVDGRRSELTNGIAEDLRRTTWEPPEGCDEVTFAANGLARHHWSPEWSRRIAIVSPFCDAAALGHLTGLAQEAPVLVSRPDQLACVSDERLDAFGRVAVLDEQAETEDGEEPRAGEQRGLHAKIYIQERGGRTALTIGSGNATGAALLRARGRPTANVEVFATLDGKRSRLGGIDDILGDKGLGRLTRDFERGEVAKPDPVDISAGLDPRPCRRRASNDLRRPSDHRGRCTFVCDARGAGGCVHLQPGGAVHAPRAHRRGCSTRDRRNRIPTASASAGRFSYAGGGLIVGFEVDGRVLPSALIQKPKFRASKRLLGIYSSATSRSEPGSDASPRFSALRSANRV